MSDTPRRGRPPGDPNHPRRGKGAGTGGPARGAATSAKAATFTAENQPPPEAKSAGKDVAAEIRARIAERKEAILEAQLLRATDPSHPQGHQAAADLLNRIMPPESKTTLAVTTDPDQLTDDQLAAIAAGGRVAPSGTAPAQD